MPLRLDYHGQTSIPVEVEGLLPHAVREKSVAEVERLEIFHGNERLPLAELFKVSGSAGDNRLEFTGDLAGVHWIGAKLDGGTIHVTGDVGRHLGSEMTAGEIHVEGSAGDWVGGELHGGQIQVRGGAGNFVGAAYRGSPRGMTGGVLIIRGDAGDQVGHTMRRGLVVVGGRCGDLAGINMIAGTLLVFGAPGMRAGAGMRRGTIGLMTTPEPKLLPTFVRGGIDRPLFLQLLFRELRGLGFDVPNECWTSAYRMYHGDMAGVGRGEILAPAAG